MKRSIIIRNPNSAGSALPRRPIIIRHARIAWDENPLNHPTRLRVMKRRTGILPVSIFFPSAVKIISMRCEPTKFQTISRCIPKGSDLLGANRTKAPRGRGAPRNRSVHSMFSVRCSMFPQTFTPSPQSIHPKTHQSTNPTPPVVPRRARSCRGIPRPHSAFERIPA